MKIKNHTNALINTIGLSLFFLTVIIKSIQRSYLAGIPSSRISQAVSFCYLLFFALWIVSLQWRIVQKQVKNYLTATASMEFFWILVRTIKFLYLRTETPMRYAWYLYYLPILMIPALCLILAISMGRPEDYRLPKKVLLLPVASLALFVLVLTNDLHKTVFIIPPGMNGFDIGNYSYGFGYDIIVTYIGICAAASFLIMLAKCRIPGRKYLRFSPAIPLVLLAAGCFRYVRGKEWIFGFYKMDITAFICFFTTFALESCIQTGLILANTGYGELFGMCSINAVITDEDYNPLISSDTYREIPREKMRRSESRPVTLENGIRLSSAPIKGGHILWQDNLSELNAVLSRLAELNDYLQGKNQSIQKTYDYQKKERQLIEKNRLYNRILTHTKAEIECYSRLVEQLAAETDPQKTKQLAIKIAFVSAFIKRRDNLIFLGEEEKPIAPAELSYCIEESLSNLRLGGVECFCSSELETPLAFDGISRLYESFYKIIFPLIDTLSSLCVYLIEEDGKTAIVMRILCRGDAELTFPDNSRIRAEKENDEWTVTICG